MKEHAFALIKGNVDGLVNALSMTGAAPEVVDALMHAPQWNLGVGAGLQVTYFAVRPKLANALTESGEIVSKYADIYIWARCAPVGESITESAIFRHLLLTHPLLCSAFDQLIKSLYPSLNEWRYEVNADSSHEAFLTKAPSCFIYV